MLDELIVALGPDLRHLPQIAPLPLLDRELLTLVTGQEGFFERALGLGLPLTRTDGRWWRLPGPVRDHLATFGPIDPVALDAAAGTMRGTASWAPRFSCCSPRARATTRHGRSRTPIRSTFAELGVSMRTELQDFEETLVA